MKHLSNMYPNLIYQTHFRLNKINEIKDYFIAEICEREPISKRLREQVQVLVLRFR